eukprot:m.189915 g.189915  ORF g.189915 m.189915 type:complete len:412 (-) comp17888_c0_seq1:248-1483(-)
MQATVAPAQPPTTTISHISVFLLLLATTVSPCLSQTPHPPGQPPFPTPLPVFPTAWFGADPTAFEYQDPAKLKQMSGYRAIFMSWAEMMIGANWTNGTEIMAAACEGFKDALGPNGTAVFGYNQGQVAPLFYPEVLTLTQDLSKYGDYFLGYDNATNTLTMNSTTFCAQMYVKPDTPQTKNCLSYYWNFCNEDAVDYYINTVLTNMISKNGQRRNMDGLFIDWAGNFNDKQCPGQAMKVHLLTFQLLQKYQMWPVFSLAGTTEEAALLWNAGVAYTQFTEYWTPSDGGISQLYNLTEVMGVPSVVHTPIIHPRAPHTAIMDAVAGFLIGAGGANHSYLMYGTSWTSDKGWPWSPLFDIEYGKPTGPPTRTMDGNNTVWQRHFTSGAVATVTCPPKSRSCPGNITGISIPIM